jgi:hypothetical protein
MSKPIRILTAILVSLLLGGMFAYQDAQKNEPTYQQHPVTVILTNFFCGSLVGLIFYFGSGWLTKRKERKTKQKTNSLLPNESATVDLGDNKFYDQVAGELQNKTLIPGLWTKAYAVANGDEAKARALYIRYRVQHLAAETARQHESVEQKRNREIALIRKQLSRLCDQKHKDDDRIPNNKFESIPSKLLYPVNASIVADALGLTETEIIIAIRNGHAKGIRCDGDWFVDLGTEASS